jgi:hypothetical protein
MISLFFNELISHLGLLELPLKGRSYIWSNMQQNPLLVQLDWFFSTPNWTTFYPNTVVLPLAKPTSDHVPCVVSIDTVIPQANIFRFENYWVEQKGFLDCVSTAWNLDCWGKNAAALLSKKLKLLRGALKVWKVGLSQLKNSIVRCNIVIAFLDNLEEERPLFLTENNFRNIVKAHYEKLLHAQFLYWKKRCTARWIKLGEEKTKYFHSMAIIRYKKKSIVSLITEDGRNVTEHEEMAAMA